MKMQITRREGNLRADDVFYDDAPPSPLIFADVNNVPIAAANLVRASSPVTRDRCRSNGALNTNESGEIPSNFSLHVPTFMTASPVRSRGGFDVVFRVSRIVVFSPVQMCRDIDHR